MTVRLLAFAGSTGTGSLNQALLDLAVTEARGRGAEVTSLKLNDFALPMFDGDLEASDFPQGVRDLKVLFRSHHGFLIARVQRLDQRGAEKRHRLGLAAYPRRG